MFHVIFVFLFFLAAVRAVLVVQCKEKRSYEENLPLCRRSPLGEITQDDDIIKSASTEGEKGGSGCKGDGIETGNGWARFELGRIGFNASRNGCGWL